MIQPFIFVSYSHKDEKEKDLLISHLRVLRLTDLIELWNDDYIGAGHNWEKEIDRAMAQCSVAVLLITANFLTSDFIIHQEVPKLLERRESEDLIIFPVVAKACAWQRVDWLKSINVRPKNGKPVWSDGASHVDEDLATITLEIADIIEKADTDSLSEVGTRVLSPSVKVTMASTTYVRDSNEPRIITNNIRILIVEDESRWQKELKEILRSSIDGVDIKIAPNYNVALENLADESYDLITVDLRLPGGPAEPQVSKAFGMNLLRELRNSRLNQSCGLIVISAAATIADARQAFRDYEAYEIIDKNSFDRLNFIETTQGAILNARLRYAAVKTSARSRLNILFGKEHFVGSELHGPDWRTTYISHNPKRLDTTDLIIRGDKLNLSMFPFGSKSWLSEVNFISNNIYNALANDVHILNDLNTAQNMVQPSSDLWVQFSGPVFGLSIPFELLCKENDYLGLNYIFTRQSEQADLSLTRNREPFHVFFSNLRENRETLRVLIAGANFNGRSPSSESEATLLAKDMKSDMERLGISLQIDLLLNEDVTYSRVKEALQYGRYHIFHYAGHGSYDDILTENGGLIVREIKNLCFLKGVDLNLLTRDTNLRMAFLSCCLSGRTTTQIGRGFFHETLGEFFRAGVTSLLSYRWKIPDSKALSFAQAFYRGLWHSFSPGEALLYARREIARSEQDIDDMSWLSPVMLM